MAPIALNKKLNLVLPVDTDNGKIWVHSVPVSREVFESNYVLLTRTLSNMYANGIGPSFAPRVALLALKDTAKEMNDEEDISAPILNEIYRITNVLKPSENGQYQTIPFFEAKAKKIIDDQSLAEVENAIVYFIVASALHLKRELPMAYQSLKSAWSAETTSLTVTEYGTSLSTSTTPENTGEKQAPSPRPVVQRVSSIPS